MAFKLKKLILLAMIVGSAKAYCGRLKPPDPPKTFVPSFSLDSHTHAEAFLDAELSSFVQKPWIEQPLHQIVTHTSSQILIKPSSFAHSSFTVDFTFAAEPSSVGINYVCAKSPKVSIPKKTSEHTFFYRFSNLGEEPSLTDHRLSTTQEITTQTLSPIKASTLDILKTYPRCPIALHHDPFEYSPVSFKGSYNLPKNPSKKHLTIFCPAVAFCIDKQTQDLFRPTPQLEAVSELMINETVAQITVPAFDIQMAKDLRFDSDLQIDGLEPIEIRFNRYSSHLFKPLRQTLVRTTFPLDTRFTLSDDPEFDQPAQPTYVHVFSNLCFKACSPFILQPLPLTLALPTIETSQFQLRDGFHALITLPAIHKKAKILPALRAHFPFSTVASNQLQLDGHQSRKAHLRPHQIDHAVQAVQLQISIRPIVLDGHHVKIPSFTYASTLVPNQLQISTKHTPYIHKATTFKSLIGHELITSLDPNAIKASSPKTARHQFHLRRIKTSRLRLESGDVKMLEIEKPNPFGFSTFNTIHFDSMEHFCSIPTILHPASGHHAKTQVQLALIHNAKKRHLPVKEHYIRKFGHMPTFEAYAAPTLENHTIASPRLPSIEPTKPYLWQSIDEPLALKACSKQLQNFQDKQGSNLNRSYRLISANLSGLPTLYDLDTSSQTSEFSANVSWIPQTQGKRYLFAVAVKPSETARFNRIQQHIHFVIDNSQAIDKSKLNAYKNAILRALPYIQKGDTFNISHYDDDLAHFSPTPLPVTSTTKAAARNYLNGLKLYHPFQKTNTYQLLNALAKNLESQAGMHTVFLFTDGQTLTHLPKKCEDAKNLLSLNKSSFNLYPVCVGGNNQFNHVRLLSTLQRGHTFHSQSLVAFPRKFATFVKKTSQTIARDVHVVAMHEDANRSIQLISESPRLPSMFKDQPLIIYGETDSLEPFSLMIQARFSQSYVNIHKKLTFDPKPTTNTMQFEQFYFDKAASKLNAFYEIPSRESLELGNSILRSNTPCK